MVAGLGVEIQPLIETAVRRGGHVRVGLEDAPMRCSVGNLAQVKDARRRIESAGATLADAGAVRARLRASQPAAARP
jgi:uncharacterized protein (DUF849 family)